MVIKEFICLLLAAVGLFGLARADGVPAPYDVQVDLQHAKQITILAINHGVEKGAANDPITEVCKSFRLSPKRVKLFFRTAKKITLEKFNNNADWLPCYVAGSAKVDKSIVDWKISASGMAKVWTTKRHEVVLLLACDEDCQRLVFGAAVENGI